MTVRILECEQRSPEWWEARMGIPTASEFHTVLAKGKKGEESKTRKTYMLKLAGEILTGEPMYHYENDHMERGRIMEDEARELYVFMEGGIWLQRVGFIRNDNKGCSPDSLIGNDGMLEIKTRLAHLQIDALLADEFLPEHVAQCQGALWVAEREWIDLAAYWPRLPLLVKRAYRDEKYIKELSAAVDQFNEELHEVVERIRSYGKQEAAQ